MATVHNKRISEIMESSTLWMPRALASLSYTGWDSGRISLVDRPAPLRAPQLLVGAWGSWDRALRTWC